MGKKRKYIYQKGKTDSQTRLVTSVGGHEIPSNCEVTVVFPSSQENDADIEQRMKILASGMRGHALREHRYVVVCGQSVPVKNRQSYRKEKNKIIGDVSPEVMQWLNGEISQTGEHIEQVVQPTRTMAQPPSFSTQTARTMPPLPSLFSTQTARTMPQPPPYSMQTRTMPPLPSYSLQTASTMAPQPPYSMQARTMPQLPPLSTQTEKAAHERESLILNLPKLRLDVTINKGIIEKIINEESQGTQVTLDTNDLFQLQIKYFSKIMEITEELKSEYKTLLYQAELEQMAARKEFLVKKLEGLAKQTVQPTPDLFSSTEAEQDVPVSVQTPISEKEDEDEIEYRSTGKRKAELLSINGLFSSETQMLKRKRIQTERSEEIEDHEEGLIIDESEEEADNLIIDEFESVYNDFKL